MFAGRPPRWECRSKRRGARWSVWRPQASFGVTRSPGAVEPGGLRKSWTSWMRWPRDSGAGRLPRTSDTTSSRRARLALGMWERSPGYGRPRESGHAPPPSRHALRTTGEPRVVENAPQTASTAPAGPDHARQSASSRPGHSDPPDSHHRRGRSTRPGACPSSRGHSTPSGTAFPSPHARHVPRRKRMSPATQKCPQPPGTPAQLRCRAPTARRRSRAAPQGPWARSRPRRRPASPPAHRATC